MRHGLSCVAAAALVLGAIGMVDAQQAGAPDGQAGGGVGAGSPGGIPLTPEQIRDLGKRFGDTRRAQEGAMTEVASPASRRVNMSFAPGGTVPIVQVVKGYPTALSFFDSTGQPWPIAWDTNSNPAGVAGGANCSGNPSSGGPAVAAVGFYVCTPVKGSNVIEITPMSLQPRGGLLVTLDNAPKPLSFLLIGGGGTYDADMSVQVSERGPHAKAPLMQASAPDTAAPFLTSMLEGVPPADATPLAVTGVSPDDLRAWKIGDQMFLRTRLTLISPEWTASENGEGGMTIYSVPATPVVLLSAHGRTISASFTEE